MKILDCRNMACPAPVVATKRALEEAVGEPLQVLVDQGAPRENVTRFAVNRGYTVSETAHGNGFALTIGGGQPPASPQTGTAESAATRVVLVSSDRLGNGPEELGRLLMKNFLITLLDLETVPDRLLFVNSGVFLTTEGSEVLEVLEKLGNRGVEVLSCGACLDFFQRKEQLQAGAVGNMFTIAESLMTAGSVINL
jgi:selenium metabolism protein YedF